MRNIVITAAVIGGLGVFMAQMADKIDAGDGDSRRGKAGGDRRDGDVALQAGSRSLSIPRDSRGHFADRRPHRRPAHRLHGRYRRLRDRAERILRRAVRPAPGAEPVHGACLDRERHHQGRARTRLAMVEVGGLVVRDVDAMVLPDEALSENLLGLSFLSKLRRFEYANGTMVLEQ